MQRICISSFLITLRTREIEGWTTVKSLVAWLESTFIDSERLSVNELGGEGSIRTTSFSTSRTTVNMMPRSWPSRAQLTWKAFGHLPFVHWTGAPWAFDLIFVHAEHFYTFNTAHQICIYHVKEESIPNSIDLSRCHRHRTQLSLYRHPRNLDRQPRSRGRFLHNDHEPSMTWDFLRPLPHLVCW